MAPNVNQIELHPYFSQEKQRVWDREHGVVTEYWIPLGGANSLLQDPTIQKIAESQQKSIAQIILHWHIQLGALPLCKSSSSKRQLENLSVFDFSLTDE